MVPVACLRIRGFSFWPLYLRAVLVLQSHWTWPLLIYSASSNPPWRSRARVHSIPTETRGSSFSRTCGRKTRSADGPRQTGVFGSKSRAPYSLGPEDSLGSCWPDLHFTAVPPLWLELVFPLFCPGGLNCKWRRNWLYVAYAPGQCCSKAS